MCLPELDEKAVELQPRCEKSLKNRTHDTIKVIV